MCLFFIAHDYVQRQSSDSQVRVDRIPIGVPPPVPDLPLCFGMLKHRAALARVGEGGGDIFLPKKIRWIFAYVVQFDAVYMSDLI